MNHKPKTNMNTMIAQDSRYSPFSRNPTGSPISPVMQQAINKVVTSPTSAISSSVSTNQAVKTQNPASTTNYKK